MREPKPKSGSVPTKTLTRVGLVRRTAAFCASKAAIAQKTDKKATASQNVASASTTSPLQPRLAMRTVSVEKQTVAA